MVSSRPERQEKLALHSLFQATNGQGWMCKEGWETVFECDPSSCYGVTTEDGRVTKICLGCNNLDGTFFFARHAIPARGSVGSSCGGVGA